MDKKKDLTLGQVVIAVACLCLVAWLLFPMKKEEKPSAVQVNEPSIPPMAKASAVDVELERKVHVKNQAEMAAQQVIERLLKAPSTAHFHHWNLIDYTGNKTFVSVDVDAQNSFGATLRQTYCAIINVDDPRPDEFTYDTRFGVQRCETPLADNWTATMKLMNGWPGMDPDRAKLLGADAVREPRRKRRRNE